MDWGTLAGVVLGASLTYIIQRLLRREDKALKARLVLIDGLTLLWTAEYQTFKAHLHRLRAYLEDAGVKADLVSKLETKAWECWRDGQREGHQDPEQGRIIMSKLIEEYETLVDQVHDALRRPWWR